MPRRAGTICPHCGTRYVGRCPTCAARRRHRADQHRPTASQRGYGRPHRAFRAAVLERDPTCTCPGCPRCTTPHTSCTTPSREADHHPRSRRQLEADGADPNDPTHGRGLCRPCHSHHTGRTTGWGAG